MKAKFQPNRFCCNFAEVLQGFALIMGLEEEVQMMEWKRKDGKKRVKMKEF